jgi:hypothetical protein
MGIAHFLLVILLILVRADEIAEMKNTLTPPLIDLP